MHQGFLVHIENQQLTMLDALDPTDKALLVDDELVDVNRRQVVDELHAVPGTAVVLTGFHLVHAVPEGAVHVVVTLRQQGHVVDQLVGMVVLGIDATGARFETHVDVFGDQHHVETGAAGLQLD